MVTAPSSPPLPSFLCLYIEQGLASRYAMARSLTSTTAASFPGSVITSFGMQSQGSGCSDAGGRKWSPGVYVVGGEGCGCGEGEVKVDVGGGRGRGEGGSW